MRTRLIKDKRVLLGGALLIVTTLVAILAPVLTSYSPTKTHMSDLLQPPSLEHLFGTDSFGRDILSRVLYGARISLLIGMTSSVLVGMIGTFFGMIVAFVRPLEEILMRVLEGIMAIPAMLLAMIIMAILGRGIDKVILAFVIVYTPQVARLVRGEALRVQKENYLEAANALGASTLSIIWRHVLPNIVSPLLVQTSFMFAFAVLTEAGLSFLGLGVPPPKPSLGLMLAEARDYIRYAPWISWFPGFNIILIVLSMNLLGDGLRDAFDPYFRY